MTRRTPTRSRLLLALLAVVLAAAGLTSCQVARAGARCRGGVARDATHVLACRGGRWTRIMTLAAYARLLAPRPAPTAPASASTLWAVGDIARCGGDHAQVEALIHGQSGLFLAL